MTYPLLPLVEALRQDTDYVGQLEAHAYPKLSVKLYGRGVVLDTPTDGAAVRMERHQLAKPGQVILSEIWGKKGAIGIVPPEGAGALVTSHFFLFDIDGGRAYQSYIDWILRSNYLQPQLEEQARGTTGYAAVRPRHLLAACIPLPPLDEQRRIVARIDALAVKIEEARGLRRQAIEEAETLASMGFDRALEGVVAAAAATVESVAVSVTDGDHLPPPRSESGVPFVYISNVVGGKVDFAGCSWVPREYFSGLASSRVPKRGDVLYTAVGYSLGVPCLVEVDEEFCFQRHIAIIRPDPTKIISGYLTAALSSPSVYEQARRASTGSAQPTVPLRAIRKLVFPLVPLHEQERVLERAENIRCEVEALKRLQQETAAELEAMLPAVLERAFRGEL